MEFGDILQKYKLLPIWARSAVAIFIGILPGAYKYFDQGADFEDRLVEIQGHEQVAREKFETARKRKAGLPKLEEQLAFIEEQLTKAKQMLPDQYVIEEILEKTATIAKSTDVTLNRFKPMPEVPHSDEQYQYVELPIDTEVEGEFHKIAKFLDKLVHLEQSIFVRRLVMVPIIGAQPFSAVPGSKALGTPDQPSPFELARDTREKIREKANFSLVVYRGMGPQDAVRTNLIPAMPNAPQPVNSLLNATPKTPVQPTLAPPPA